MNPMTIEGYDAVAGMLQLRAIDTGRLYEINVDEVAHALDNPDAHTEREPSPAPIPSPSGEYSGMPAPDAPGGPNVPDDGNAPQDPPEPDTIL